MAFDRAAAISGVFTHLEKQFGKGVIMRLGEHVDVDMETISTGSMGLDLALGIGGLPLGRMVEIYGPESSGKTTLALSVIAQAQKKGKICAFIDAEHALDPGYASRLGVNVGTLLLAQPDTAEQALEITHSLVHASAVDVVVIDSVAALAPRAEVEGMMGESHLGLQARLMSQALRKLTAPVKNAKALVIFINQIRMKIGTFFAHPETTSGGHALKFYASVRLDIRKIAMIKVNEVVVGNETRVKVVKNKLAPPFRHAEFQILYGTGICHESELVALATHYKLLDRQGTWYSYEGERLGQGRGSVLLFFKAHPEVADALQKKIALSHAAL